MKTYQQKGNTALLIIDHKTSKKVLINNVILLKGDINYTILYLENGKQKVVAHSIKFFEPYLVSKTKAGQIGIRLVFGIYVEFLRCTGKLQLTNFSHIKFRGFLHT